MSAHAEPFRARAGRRALILFVWETISILERTPPELPDAIRTALRRGERAAPCGGGRPLLDAGEQTRSTTGPKFIDCGGGGDDGFAVNDVLKLLRVAANTLNRTDWVRLCLALKWEIGDAARAAWLDFSERYEGDKTPGEAEHVWDTAKPTGGLSLGTIVHLLRESGLPAGYVPASRRSSRAHPTVPASATSAPAGDPDDDEWGNADPCPGEGIVLKPGEDIDNDGFGQTEDDVARAFATWHRDDLRRDHDADRWYGWSGDRWAPDMLGRTTDAAREIARMARQVVPGRLRAKMSTASFVMNVERLARCDPALAVRQDHWDRDPFLLGCPGGTVDLRTGVMRPPSPDDRITRQTAVAPAETADCPLWLAFLRASTGDDEKAIRFLGAWAGYCLTGDVSEHTLVFLYGPGGNGKSLFLNALAGILGDYAVTASMDTFTAPKSDRHPTDLAMLRGARLVTASETEEGRPWAEARIKQVTGGDAITARFMRQDFFTFEPTFKLTITGNHKPTLVNVDDAARRRFRIVPFTRTPTTPDRELGAKLRAEWPGILRWMIEGALDWRANGLVVPDAVAEATTEYFSDQDVFAHWAEERCRVEPGNTHLWASSDELFRSWSDYARAAGEEPGAQKRFGDSMRRRGFAGQQRRVQGQLKRGWSGIELRVPATDNRYGD